MSIALSTMWWETGLNALKPLAWHTRHMGFDQVELNYRLPAEVLPALQQALTQAGLGVSSLHVPFPAPPEENALRQTDLASEDPQVRRRAQARVSATLEEAARWGAGVVVLHAGNIEPLRPLETRLQELYRAGRAEGDEFRQLRHELRQRRAEAAPRHLAWVQQALARFVPRAQALGLIIGLENRAHYRDLPSLEEMGQLLETFGPTVGYWHDTGHAFRLEIQGFSPQAAWLQRHGTRLVGLHLHDSSGMEDHQPPGQGEIRFDQLAALLPKKERPVLEIRPQHNAEAIEAGLAHLRASGVLP